MKKIFIYQVLIVIISVLIFGLIGFLSLMTYGGNYCDQPPELTCNCFCCDLFNLRGYESCSQIGLYIGLLVGIIIGITSLSIIRRKFLKIYNN